MTSRERVFAALDHKTPDRCPVDFWAEDAMVKTLFHYFGTDSYEKLLDIFEADIMFVFPESHEPPAKVNPDGTFTAYSGERYRRVKNNYCEYTECVEAPLAFAETAEDLKDYDRWPDTSRVNWAGFRDRIGALSEKRVIKLHTGGLYERAWALRGQELFLTDMALEPEIPHYIMGKLCDYWCEYVERAIESAGDLIDIVYTYDDIASQNGLIMSPAMLEEFVYPYHRKLNAVIKSAGKRVLYHSCGSIITQIDNLKALPIDILNPLQPLAKGMDFAAIKAKWGRDLCFHGGIDIQETLPHGTPDDVRHAVRSAIETLGGDGGYIMTSAHYIQNDTPVENVIAMYDPALR